MTVGELIKELQGFPSELEVLIMDGYQALGWRGDFDLQTFVDVDGTVYADIGIGGLLETNC